MGETILEKMISTNISTVQFQDEKKEPKPTMDAMLIWSHCEEEEQLEMLSSKQNPGETETRVGWFWETINVNKEHENYLKLYLKYDGPYKFSGIGTHLGSGETFEIIEGEVNKRTKYWKFIALYENSLKNVSFSIGVGHMVKFGAVVITIKNQIIWTKNYV